MLNSRKILSQIRYQCPVFLFFFWTFKKWCIIPRNYHPLPLSLQKEKMLAKIKGGKIVNVSAGTPPKTGTSSLAPTHAGQIRIILIADWRTPGDWCALPFSVDVSIFLNRISFHEEWIKFCPVIYWSPLWLLLAVPEPPNLKCPPLIRIK